MVTGIASGIRISQSARLVSTLGILGPGSLSVLRVAEQDCYLVLVQLAKCFWWSCEADIPIHLNKILKEPFLCHFIDLYHVYVNLLSSCVVTVKLLHVKIKMNELWLNFYCSLVIYGVVTESLMTNCFCNRYFTYSISVYAILTQGSRYTFFVKSPWAIPMWIFKGTKQIFQFFLTPSIKIQYGTNFPIFWGSLDPQVKFCLGLVRFSGAWRPKLQPQCPVIILRDLYNYTSYHLKLWCIAVSNISSYARNLH